MGSMNRVRRATRRDHHELVRMQSSLLPREPAEPEVKEWFRKQLTVFVVDCGRGRLGGFITIGLRSYAEGGSSSPIPFVEQWFVDRDLRRRGFGRTLMNAAEDWARRRGYREPASDTWLSNR